MGEQVFIGLATSGLCAAGLVREGWFLSETPKGQWLVESFGTRNALWLLRALFALGILFGLALATGIVNPVRWTTIPRERRDLTSVDRTQSAQSPHATGSCCPTTRARAQRLLSGIVTL